MSVSIRIDGSGAALAALGGIAARAEHPRGMWDAIGAALEASTQQRFLEGRGPGGVWPPSLRVRFSGGKTLVDTGRLMQSITRNASDSGVEVGTNVIYAAIQQFGGTIHAKTSKGLRWSYNRSGANKKQWARKMSVTLPARPFLGIDTEDESEILFIAESWLAGERDAR